KDPRKERVISVGTIVPVGKDLNVRLVYTADIQPYQQVNIFSRVDGYIAKIYVDKGDFVKADQLLVEVDHTDYVHAVNRAKANLEAARANVVSQEATIRNAKLNLDRMRALIKDQYVSQQDLDNAQAAYDVEKDVSLVKIGQPAELRADAYPGRVFTGKVTRVVQALNPSTRTMTVEVDIPNPDRALKGGMFARVELLVGVHANALQIPID